MTVQKIDDSPWVTFPSLGDIPDEGVIFQTSPSLAIRRLLLPPVMAIARALRRCRWHRGQDLRLALLRPPSACSCPRTKVPRSRLLPRQVRPYHSWAASVQADRLVSRKPYRVATRTEESTLSASMRLARPVPQ